MTGYNGSNAGFGPTLGPMLRTTQGVSQFDHFQQSSYSKTAGAAIWTWNDAADDNGAVTIRPTTGVHGGVMELTTHTGAADDVFAQMGGAPFILAAGSRTGFAARAAIADVSNSLTLLALHDADTDITDGIGTATAWDGFGFYTNSTGEVFFRCGDGAASESWTTGMTVVDDEYFNVAAEVYDDAGTWKAVVSASKDDTDTPFVKRLSGLAEVPTSALTCSIGVETGGTTAAVLTCDWIGAIASSD